MPELRHPSLSAYAIHRCRCEPCVEFHRQYQREWRAGEHGSVPAKPYKILIRKLLRKESYPKLAARTGVSASTLCLIATGRRNTIHKRIADKLDAA